VLNALSLFTGIDEFGRNNGLAVLAASAMSMLRGGCMTMLVFFAASVLIAVIDIFRPRAISAFLLAVLDSIEAVPIFIWVLAGTVAAPNMGFWLTATIFMVAALPLVFTTLRGYVVDVMLQPYCEAAIVVGTDGWRLMWRHVFPNVLPYAIPLFIHVLGAAIAVYGAVGVFGFVSRDAFDLGVFLLRGREQAGFDLTVLVSTLTAYLVIYVGLRVASSRLSQRALINRPVAKVPSPWTA